MAHQVAEVIEKPKASKENKPEKQNMRLRTGLKVGFAVTTE
jgi:hypothetical protein